MASFPPRLPIAGGISIRSESIKIIVGAGTPAATFYVHKDLATNYSDFLAVLLRNGCKEAEEKALTLPEDDPEVFDIFAKFCYSGRIYSIKEGDLYTLESGATVHKEWRRLGQSLILGDKLGSIPFKDAVLDAICRLLSTGGYPNALQKEAFGATMPECSFRILMVDIVVWKWTDGDFEKAVDPGNGFYGAVAKRMANVTRDGGKGPVPFAVADCTYHEHGTDKACHRTMFPA